jgi:hypothetical protein
MQSPIGDEGRWDRAPNQRFDRIGTVAALAKRIEQGKPDKVPRDGASRGLLTEALSSLSLHWR